MRTLAVLMIVAAGSAAGYAQEAPESFQATIKAFRQSQVNARTVGNVSEVLVGEGQRVQAGQILAQLEDGGPRANYDLAVLQSKNDSALKSAQLLLEQRKRELERIKSLEARGTSAPIELELAEYNHSSAQLSITARQEELDQLGQVAKVRLAMLEDYKVTAPFAGIVAAKLIEVGETTPIDRPLFEIIDVSRVYAVFPLPVAWVTSAEEGRKVTVTLDLYPENTFDGTITFLAPAAQSGGRYFLAKALLDNADGLLRPEMKAQVALAAAAPAATGDAQGADASTATQAPAEAQ